MNDVLINVAYLVASVLFIAGLKGLSHPRTAVRGNLLGSSAMLIAIVATLFKTGIIGWAWIFTGILVGGLIGAVLAQKIQMTAMPQLVALFNGFGGVASVLVAGEALISSKSTAVPMLIATGASGLIGAITFCGSLVAFAKLQELVSGNPVLLPGRHVLNGLLALACVVLALMLVMNPANTNLYWMLAAVASVLGVTLVIPVGGADMPVVIALLNSYSGIAAAATGSPTPATASSSR